MGRSPESDIEGEAFVAAAEKHWSNSGSRFTVVRRILCQAIARHDMPFDPETLLALAHKADPIISLSSVYRTLKTLEEAGLLSRIDGADGSRLYRKSARDETASSHIVCRDCGAIIPIADPCMSLRESAGPRAEGFLPERIVLRVEARCSEYARHGSCTRK